MSLKQALKGLAQRRDAEEEEEHLSISQFRARRDRVKATECFIPLTMVDPKGKAPETPFSKSQKKMKTEGSVQGEQKERSSWLPPYPLS